MIRGRSLIAAVAACAVLLVAAAPVHPSLRSDAGRAYAVAERRLAGLKKSPKKKQYRSYWLDCARTFELVEKKYPGSPQAAAACFDRAGVYRALYQHSGYSKDIDEALRVYRKCRTAHARHARAPEALYRIIDIALKHKKDESLAGDAYARLSKSYPGNNWTVKARTRMRLSAHKAPVKRKQRQASVVSGKSIARGTVRNIRYWSGGDYTRIVIDHEKKVAFQVLELKNPARLVFDLQQAQLSPSMNKEPLKVNDGILRQVRASQYAPDIVRVVLDLSSVKGYAVFPLRDPQRLVIDVTGEAGADKSPPPTAGASKAGSGAGLSLSRQLGLKVRTIAIDAGHGGHDPGAIGKRGAKEKDITLDIARRLAALVEEGTGCNVVMTRNRDEFIPLEERPAIARTKGADLFVSIHVNASPRRRVSGIETYIQGLRASDRDAMATAARENATTDKTLGELDDELAKILTGLRMESNDEDSIQLAHVVHGALVDAVKPLQHHVNDLGVKRAFFYVLINTGMPSILAEVGFISNPAEEKLLKKGSYRQSIAEALYDGVKKYVDAREPQIAGVGSSAS
jgi:N-acetylmuramoyl-L-alanine amidase